MPLYRYAQSGLEPLSRTTFGAEGIRERQDLQAILRDKIEIVDADLLVIGEEYGAFEGSRRRVDLLAVDRTGTLVVIELKRTEDGGHMELQALRYAAMVSTMTLDHAAASYASLRSVDEDDARQVITSWIDGAFESFASHVKIVLVAGDFGTEITSTVLWLNANYNTDITCVRMVSYKLDEQVLFDVQPIIPLPEARDFQIHQQLKAATAAVERSSGRDWTKYDLTIGDDGYPNLSKQGAIKRAVIELVDRGVNLAKIQDATHRGSWVRVSPRPDEPIETAFRRENPSRGRSHVWYDLNIADGESWWVMPRFGGLETEELLAALRIAAGDVEFRWSRAAEA